MAGHKGSHTSVECASTHMPKARTLGPTTCKWFIVMRQSAKPICCNGSSNDIVHETSSIARSNYMAGTRKMDFFMKHATAWHVIGLLSIVERV